MLINEFGIFINVNCGKTEEVKMIRPMDNIYLNNIFHRVNFWSDFDCEIYLCGTSRTKKAKTFFTITRRV